MPSAASSTIPIFLSSARPRPSYVAACSVFACRNNQFKQILAALPLFVWQRCQSMLSGNASAAKSGVKGDQGARRPEEIPIEPGRNEMTVLTPTLPVEAVAEIETRRVAYSKVFWRIVPFLMLCYVVAYLDRVNVGFAKLADVRGPRLQRDRLRPRRRHLLHRLFPVRGAEQRHPAQGRRAHVDRAHHDHLGPDLRRLHVRQSAPMFYLLRFLLGVAEAGFYPGHHPFPDLLVSFAPPRQNHRRLHVRNSDLRNLRQPAFRLDHGLVPRRQRSCRLAVDVPHRGGSRRPARHRRLLLPRQWHP